jgi:transcription antitermination factor NusG
VDRKALVYKEVADPARAEKIVALMDKLEVEMKLQSEINKQGQQTILMLNTDYDTTPEQLQKQMDVIQTSRYQNRQRILDTYFQIKALMTRQEWEAISKPEGEMLMQMINKAKVPVK